MDRRAGRISAGGPRSLLIRVIVVNAAVLIVIGGALVLASAEGDDPVTLGQGLKVLAALAVLVAAYLFLLWRALTPLRRLTDGMGRVQHHHARPYTENERIDVARELDDELGHPRRRSNS